MSFSNSDTTSVPFKLPNGKSVRIEVSQSGRRDTSTQVDNHIFEEITEILKGVATVLEETWQEAKPDKATVKFGLGLEIESGKLAAIIAKGSAKANLEITLEWGK